MFVHVGSSAILVLSVIC
uniref:Uncharacterized protein n=1 Tax=Arundo donax TaxID=35708 RepID=A0A0A8Z4C2_ARUDO